MGEVTHTAVFKAVGVTAQQDFFEVKAGTNAAAFVHGFVLSQSTEIGDAQEEMLQMTANRGIGAVTAGSGGSSVTPQKRRRGDSAWSGTVRSNDTTKLAAGSGTLETDLEVHTWNERVPYVFWYTPEARPLICPGDTWTLELETTPADGLTISGTIYLEQVGT